MAKQVLRDSRLKKSSGSTREDRESQEREITQDREMTDSERLDMFRQSMFQSALPDLPKIKGYHVCWLTTTNPRDSIHARARLGYTPIKVSDIPGWDHTSIKTGEYEGCIGINEMVAFKLPLHLYEAYMKHAHHDEPLREEGKLKDAIDAARAQMDQDGLLKRGVTLIEEEGNAELGKDPGAPRFSRLTGER